MRDGQRPANTITIFLKHHNDRAGKFAPRDGVCTSHAESNRVGCGQAIRRYVTYPREKGMYFDGEPIVVEQFPVRQDGAVIAVVKTDNVHFATCPARKKPRPTTGFEDFKTNAAGG
jgi:hypothetical protein